MLGPSHTQTTPRDRRNILRNSVLLTAWVASLVLNYEVFHRDLAAPVGTLAALLPLIIGAAVIWSHVRFVRDADDLQKAIQLGALSIAFGVSVVFTLAYPPLQRFGLPPLEPNHFAAIGVLTYLLATTFYSIRYR